MLSSGKLTVPSPIVNLMRHLLLGLLARQVLLVLLLLLLSTGATSGGHVVGEQFAVTGGTGNNLRLQVDKVQNLISTSSTAANSNSYVQQINYYSKL
jgi:hypothetical protein